jgi:hypothetical protein
LWRHAPLKALDRLLSNRQLHQQILPLHQSMLPWLISHCRCYWWTGLISKATDAGVCCGHRYRWVAGH